MATPRLEISFHGRVIEHLGIEMYHSPVAAIAELVSNAWDAEATSADIQLPKALGDGATISISDNGDGMTALQCQERFLRVGYNRRTHDGEERTRSGRPVMGRKGIGKFAGFGIARVVDISTVSAATGEKTVFRLDSARLLGRGDEVAYVDSSPMEVAVLEHFAPHEGRKAEHGTTITLRHLTLKQTPSETVFRKSMARRFLLLEYAEGFLVTVNGQPTVRDADSDRIEFDFPTAYNGEIPDGVTIRDGWGHETVAGNEIQWRFRFYRDPIDEDELGGISVFSHGKLAQRPFFFNLSGGVGGQTGLVYLSGTVRADYIDEQPADLISTERQRINWEDDASRPLQDWGQERIKNLLRRWQAARAEQKIRAINERLAGFSERLQNLPRSERRVVERALKAIARIAVLSDRNFDDLANAILTAWEGGRLHDMIIDLADADEMDAEVLVKLLAENEVISALHAAERVKGQLNLVLGLEERIKGRQLENAIRDYISKNPWLISPEWETFRVETSVDHLIREAATEAGLERREEWRARIDLALASGDHLLIIEFMRPGLNVDWDHIGRFDRYVRVLREKVYANSGKFRRVSGLLVADRLERPPGLRGRLESLRRDDMDAMDWQTLLATARAKWVDYFKILIGRAPNDQRIQTLRDASRAFDEVVNSQTSSAEAKPMEQ